MPDITAEIRAMLARVPTGYTPGPWEWRRSPGAEHYELTAVDLPRWPQLAICDHDARQENLDLAALAPDLVAALTQALAALEAQPPAADAALLASANRELCERLEEAERDLSWQVSEHGTQEEQEREEAEGAAEWAEIEAMPIEDVRAALAADGIDPAESTASVRAVIRLAVGSRALREDLALARAEIARLQAHAKALAECAVLRCFEEYRDVRWCDSCSDTEHCPVADYRRAFPEATPAPPRTLPAAEVPDDR